MPQSSKKNNPQGKRKLDDQVSQDMLPLLHKSVYIDIVKNARQVDILEDHLKKLGATVEKFLSREVNYVISSSAPPSKADEKASNGDNANSPSFSVLSPFSSIPSPTAATDTKVPVVSRGKALAQIAYAKSRASSVVANAEKWGIKVISVEAALKWAEKEIQKMTKEAEKKRELKQGTKKGDPVAKKKNIKKKKHFLRGCYVKFEATNRMYRPVMLELNKWPKINLLAPLGLNPYTETKINVHNLHRRHSSFRKTRGSLSSATARNNLKRFRSLPSLKESIFKESASFMTPVVASPDLKGVPITTTGDVKKHLDVSYRKRMDKLQGYCECCCIKYKNLNEHVLKEEHQSFSRDKQNYESLDCVIKELPSTSQFLQKILLQHCTKKRAESLTKHISSYPQTASTDFTIQPVISPILNDTASTNLIEVPVNCTMLNLTPKTSEILNKPTADIASKTDDERLQAVVIRRPTPSGVFVSPRRRQPTPSKKPWMQERSMVFCDSPMASLQPSNPSKNLTYLFGGPSSADISKKSSGPSPKQTSSPSKTSFVRSFIPMPEYFAATKTNHDQPHNKAKDSLGDKNDKNTFSCELSSHESHIESDTCLNTPVKVGKRKGKSFEKTPDKASQLHQHDDKSRKEKSSCDSFIDRTPITPNKIEFPVNEKGHTSNDFVKTRKSRSEMNVLETVQDTFLVSVMSKEPEINEFHKSEKTPEKGTNELLGRLELCDMKSVQTNLIIVNNGSERDMSEDLCSGTVEELCNAQQSERDEFKSNKTPKKSLVGSKLTNIEDSLSKTKISDHRVKSSLSFEDLAVKNKQADKNDIYCKTGESELKNNEKNEVKTQEQLAHQYENVGKKYLQIILTPEKLYSRIQPSPVKRDKTFNEHKHRSSSALIAESNLPKTGVFSKTENIPQKDTCVSLRRSERFDKKFVHKHSIMLNDETEKRTGGNIAAEKTGRDVSNPSETSEKIGSKSSDIGNGLRKNDICSIKTVEPELIKNPDNKVKIDELTHEHKDGEKKHIKTISASEKSLNGRVTPHGSPLTRSESNDKNSLNDQQEESEHKSFKSSMNKLEFSCNTEESNLCMIKEESTKKGNSEKQAKRKSGKRSFRAQENKDEKEKIGSMELNPFLEMPIVENKANIPTKSKLVNTLCKSITEDSNKVNKEETNNQRTDRANTESNILEEETSDATRGLTLKHYKMRERKNSDLTKISAKVLTPKEHDHHGKLKLASKKDIKTSEIPEMAEPANWTIHSSNVQKIINNKAVNLHTEELITVKERQKQSKNHEKFGKKSKMKRNNCDKFEKVRDSKKRNLKNRGAINVQRASNNDLRRKFKKYVKGEKRLRQGKTFNKLKCAKSSVSLIDYVKEATPNNLKMRERIQLQVKRVTGKERKESLSKILRKNCSTNKLDSSRAKEVSENSSDQQLKGMFNRKKYEKSGCDSAPEMKGRSRIIDPPQCCRSDILTKKCDLDMKPKGKHFQIVLKDSTLAALQVTDKSEEVVANNKRNDIISSNSFVSLKESVINHENDLNLLKFDNTNSEKAENLKKEVENTSPSKIKSRELQNEDEIDNEKDLAKVLQDFSSPEIFVPCIADRVKRRSRIAVVPTLELMLSEEQAKNSSTFGSGKKKADTISDVCKAENSAIKESAVYIVDGINENPPVLDYYPLLSEKPAFCLNSDEATEPLEEFMIADHLHNSDLSNFNGSNYNGSPLCKKPRKDGEENEVQCNTESLQSNYRSKCVDASSSKIKGKGKKRKKKKGNNGTKKESLQNKAADHNNKSIEPRIIRKCRRFVHEGFYNQDIETELDALDELVTEIKPIKNNHKTMKQNTANICAVEVINPDGRLGEKLKDEPKLSKRIFHGKTFHSTIANWGQKHTAEVEGSSQICALKNNAFCPSLVECVKKKRSCTLFNHDGQYANSGEGNETEDDVQLRKPSNDFRKEISDGDSLSLLSNPSPAVVVRRLSSAYFPSRNDKTWCKVMSRRDWSTNNVDLDKFSLDDNVSDEQKLFDASNDILDENNRFLPKKVSTKIRSPTTPRKISNMDSPFKSPQNSVTGSCKQNNGKSDNRHSRFRSKEIVSLSSPIQAHKTIGSPRIRLKLKRDLFTDCYSSTLEESYEDNPSDKGFCEKIICSEKSSDCDRSDSIDLLDTPMKRHKSISDGSPQNKNRLSSKRKHSPEHSKNKFCKFQNAKIFDSSHKSELLSMLDQFQKQKESKSKNGKRDMGSLASYLPEKKSKSKRLKRKLILSDDNNLHSKKRLRLDRKVSETINKEYEASNRLVCPQPTANTNTLCFFQNQSCDEKPVSERSGSNVGDLLNFVPNFSSPSKTNSSWDNACDSYLNTSVKSGNDKTLLDKSDDSFLATCLRSPHENDSHGSKKKTKNILSVEASPVIENVDEDIYFNHMSPQRLKSPHRLINPNRHDSPRRSITPLRSNTPLGHLGASPVFRNGISDLNSLSKLRSRANLSFSPMKSQG